MESKLEIFKILASQEQWIEVSAEDREQAWSTELINYSSDVSRWNGYLNRLTLNKILNFFKDEEKPKISPSLKTLPSIWEMNVKGFGIVLDNIKCIIIPSEADNIDEFSVPQEWVKIPQWTGSYYVPVQLNLSEDGEDGCLRCWGYTNYETLKKKAEYDEVTRSYLIERENLSSDVKALLTIKEARSEQNVSVKPLQELSRERAEAFEKRLSQSLSSPRYRIDSDEWLALVGDEGSRERLYKKRLENAHKKIELNPVSPQTETPDIEITNPLAGDIKSRLTKILQVLNAQVVAKNLGSEFAYLKETIPNIVLNRQDLTLVRGENTNNSLSKYPLIKAMPKILKLVQDKPSELVKLIENITALLEQHNEQNPREKAISLILDSAQDNTDILPALIQAITIILESTEVEQRPQEAALSSDKTNPTISKAVATVHLNFKAGNFNRGFQGSWQIRNNSSYSSEEFSFKLFYNSKILTYLADWQNRYKEWLGKDNRGPGTAQNPEQYLSNLISEALKSEVNDSYNELINNLKNWVNTSLGFSSLLADLTPSSNETHQVIIQGPLKICQLPWRKVFPNCEVFCSLGHSSSLQANPNPAIARPNIRILPVFGGDQNIDTDFDLQVLQKLLSVELFKKDYLKYPTRQELFEALWDKKRWDILFFAGHSKTAENKGYIWLNSTEKISIEEFKSTLKLANRRLKLAIFNSCDGFGLVNELADLQIPCIIVFREEVPDAVAQKFLDSFLSAYSQGKSLAASMHQAREQLESLETEYPCASWLPVVFQNPHEPFLTWESLTGSNITPTWRGCCEEMLTDTIHDRLIKNPLATDLTGFGKELVEINESARVQSLAVLDQPQLEKTQAELFDEIYALKDGRRVIITGDSGSGKSTLLQNLGQHILDRDPNALVIFVPLGQLNDSSLETYLNRWLDSAAEVIKLPETQGDRLSDIFNRHKVWLLFDAVDEWPGGGNNPLKDFYSWLNNYTNNTNNNKKKGLSELIAKNSRIVITSRKLSWKKARGFLLTDESFELLPLKDEQIQNIINRCSKNNPKLQNLWESLTQPENLYLKERCATILNLLLLCRCYQGGDLFPNITAIYEKFIKTHTWSA